MHSRSFAPRPTRRNVLAGALAAGTGLVVPRSVFAQDPRRTPAALTEAITSQTREEFRAEIEEELGYTEAATPGGTFIDANVNDIQTIHPLLAEDGASFGVVGRIYDGSSAATSAPAAGAERSGRLLGDCPGRSHLHLPSQPGREVARRHGHHRRRRAVLLRLPRQPGGRFRLHPELPGCGRVVASDRRAHLRGRRQGAALHLPL